MAWHYFHIVDSNIRAESDKAILITLCGDSKFAFWYPKKLVRPLGKTYSCSIADNMTITARQYGKRGNVIDEIEVDPDEILERFRQYTPSITKKKHEIVVETHTPAPLQAIEVKADADLIR